MHAGLSLRFIFHIRLQDKSCETFKCRGNLTLFLGLGKVTNQAYKVVLATLVDSFFENIY